ncbi:MAG: NADH-quinone oxidoreductase subunit [Acidobacteriota bacterium]|jgi:NADH-quinone oxidoreductase subunit C|nr:NADH-quinone oxidoreductase subunit [Acidobacteriota bacterium]
MTDEPKNPPESSETSPSESDETRRTADNSPAPADDKAPGSPAAADAKAGTLPPPPDLEHARPTPESQAALTGKAPSGSSTSGTTVPADTGETEKPATPSPKPKPATAAPPSNETPEEKKARLERIIAEAKAKKEAAAAAAAQGGEAQPPGGKSPEVGDPLKSPSQADLERAAKIAEAKARAAALKEAAASKAPAASAPGAAPATPGAEKPAPSAVGVPGANILNAKPPVKKKDEGPKPVEAMNHPLVQRLREQFGEAVTGAFNFVGQLSVHVKADSINAVCRALRDDAETRFDYLSDLTCVHWPERDEAPYEVVYNLYSIAKNERVRLKAAAGEEGIESVTDIWPTANWMEREVYDLFGVEFKNHPDLRRLLLPKDWDGHPLRKDYPLEFMENQWTARHLPEFTEVQREQLQQRRAYGLEILQTPDERRIRELFRDGRDPLPKEHK